VQKSLCLVANDGELFTLVTQSNDRLPAKELPMTKIEIRSGDKVVRDTATQDQGKVRLGDGAPVFGR
jgi:hypothetical protein